ncbi:MAG: hypothetical protein EBU90_17470 [Proteobacteria bacterium]|jgi:hypothetical protein|nr:hypothetical protein [Pseudomonadota bacterium]NBP15647.1 hypothetical protein [bacterium]
MLRKIAIFFFVMTLHAGFKGKKDTDPLLSHTPYPPRRVSNGPFFDVDLDSPDGDEVKNTNQFKEKLLSLLCCCCLKKSKK